MSEISRTDLISFVAGSLAGESPLCVEDAVAAALRLVDEFADHGWIVTDDGSVDETEDDIKIEFDPAVVPRWLSVGGKRYDVVESQAERLARRFDEVESTSPAVAEPEVDDDEDLSDVETTNDTMVAATIAEPRKISWLGAAPGVSQEMALRHAAWVVALADPLQDRFPKVLRAVMAT